ncbi:MAG: hypothetical protein JNK14_03510 [Chitinophagaceae bacterium]|nr:hypothetical protein [Chitinophagaceae bacterium]
MQKNLLLAILLLPLFALSQRVDLDKFRFTTQFRSLPAVRLDSTYRTFNVSVEGTRLMQGFLNDMSPENSVFIEGWRKLKKRGHLDIRIKLEDLLPESFSVKEREEIIKDRQGKESGRRKLYTQEVTYTFSAFAEISDHKSAYIGRVSLAERNYKQVYRSPEFAIRQMAEGYFLVNSLSITEQLYRNCVNRAMNFLSDRLTGDYGYGISTVTDHMWILDSKKHPEYRAHRQAFQAVSEVLFGMAADKPINGVREQLQPAISYFEGIKKKYVSTNKHDRKLRYASYYNLAVIYYYLDDPQSMQREASGLILNDFDARDGKGFESSAHYLKNLFSQTNLSSRHFPIDTASFKGPEETRVVAVK